MYNHQLDTFIKTADLGSFGKASEALYISPPAVIQQINLLEKMCGFIWYRSETRQSTRLAPFVCITFAGRWCEFKNYTNNAGA